jgi:hypothetical protein
MAHLAADLVVTLADDRPGMLAKAIGCVSAAGSTSTVTRR